jgi:hypothetical protein
MKLARYNEIIFALAGTGVLLGLVAIALFLLFVGNRSGDKPGLLVNPTKVEKPRQNLVFCPALTEPTGTFQYIPVALVVADDASRDVSLSPIAMSKYSSEGSGCGSYQYGSGSRTFNVVIRNLATGDQRLLLDRPGQIVRIHLPTNKCSTGEGPSPCGTVLWEVRSEDTNRDGTINRDDALVAYVSDFGGTKLTALTPTDATVLSVQWISKMEKWQFQVRRDSNKDGKFTEEDGSDLLETSSRNPSQAQAFIRESIMKQLDTAAR